MPNEAFFHQNPEILGLGRQFGQTPFGTYAVFSNHFGTVSPLSMFSINQQIFIQKTKPLCPNPKYLFGLGFEFRLQRSRDLANLCP